MSRERDYGIDLIKIIAFVSVMILHVFSPESQWSVNNCIYLLGTFGIPLFFMVNGYLLYDKELSLRYFGKKIKKIVLFIVPWILLVGSAVCIKDRSVGGVLLNIKRRVYFQW